MNDSDRGITAPVEILRCKTHLSYPFLLHHEGKNYLVPESADANEVAIYEEVAFPHKWRKIGVLLEDVAVIDPTLFQSNGRWWLFGADPEDGGQLNLNIWYADELFGPWQPHPGNPVKTDVCSARPAGTPFFHNGDWYRPAQDCSITYGGSVVINRVDRLSPTEFQEQQVAVITPPKEGLYRQGCHTLSAAGKQTLVDCKRISYSFAGFLHRCRRVLPD